MNALTMLALAILLAGHAAASVPLTKHLHGSSDLGESRNLRAEWNDGVLKLATADRKHHAWAVIPAPQGGWDLARSATVDVEIANTGEDPVNVMFWVVGNHGWDAVVDAATLAPRESRTLSCNLRATFPDQTPKLDPADVKQLQVMLPPQALPATAPGDQGKALTTLVLRQFTARGAAPEWKRPAGRIDVPPIEDAAPAPGKRVRVRLEDESQPAIYSVLNLPEDWQPAGKFPVIVEYPGNLFFAHACYSTGLPDQCVIGHGITKGKGAICLALPFVDRQAGRIAEDGWGDPDATAEYALKMVGQVCGKHGGDRTRIVLTGFSRGAIACGYIGLRNDRIAAMWTGFHACQHYDGDGWRGATMEGAIERARRFRGKTVFQTDNPQDKFQPVMEAMKTKVTWAQSGLGFHSTAMFLDDRPSTRQLRDWFWQLVGEARK